MGIVKEFKDFAIKGNVLDLAVGVIIGAAFGAIVKSLVDDVITPLILTPALKAAGQENIAQLSWNGVKYGNFISNIISFLVVAFVLFLVVRGANSLKRREVEVPAKPAAPSKEEILLAEIRDAIKAKDVS